jgi:hypothetical protein
VDRQNKDSLVENLSAAALLGLLALLVASASFLVDGHSEKDEQEILADLGGAKISGKTLIASDSSFRKVYPLTRKGRPLYGTILSIGDRYGKARVAAIVAPDGHVDSVEVLSVVPADAPYGREGWLTEFVGKGGDDAFPSNRSELRKPDTVSAATDSFLETHEAFSRLSGYVTGLAGSAEGR